MKEYEYLYGVEVMLSNVHGHLHLPQQVLDYGPLNKTTANGLEICSK